MTSDCSPLIACRPIVATFVACPFHANPRSQLAEVLPSPKRPTSCSKWMVPSNRRYIQKSPGKKAKVPLEIYVKAVRLVQMIVAPQRRHMQTANLTCDSYRKPSTHCPSGYAHKLHTHGQSKRCAITNRILEPNIRDDQAFPLANEFTKLKVGGTNRLNSNLSLTAERSSQIKSAERYSPPPLNISYNRLRASLSKASRLSYSVEKKDNARIHTRIAKKNSIRSIIFQKIYNYNFGSHQSGINSDNAIENLELIIGKKSRPHNGLILVIGQPKSGKTDLLWKFSEIWNTRVINVGASLSRNLTLVSEKTRHLQASTILDKIISQNARNNILLLDKIEILFDNTLKINPLQLIKRYGKTNCVIAEWPGELTGNHLQYAVGHPEHRRYDAKGFTPFILQAKGE